MTKCHLALLIAKKLLIELEQVTPTCTLKGEMGCAGPIESVHFVWLCHTLPSGLSFLCKIGDWLRVLRFILTFIDYIIFLLFDLTL